MENLFYKIRKNVVIRALLISAVFCGIYFLWLSHLGPIVTAKLKTIDTLYIAKHKIMPRNEALEDIVVFKIDDESFRKMKVRWPWPRGIIASVVDKLSSYDPALICIDSVYLGKSSDKNQDIALCEAMQKAGNVYIASYFGNDGVYVTPYQPIADSAKAFGFINKPRDADGAIRRMRPFLCSASGEIVDYSLPMKTAAHFIKTPVENIAEKMELFRDNTTHIYFFDRIDGFKTMPIWRIFDKDYDMTMLKDKIVLVGVTSKLFHDICRTPLGLMPGVIILANETVGVIEHSFFRHVSRTANILIVFIFVFLAVFCAIKLSITTSLIISVAEIAVFYTTALALFMFNIITDAFSVIFSVAFVSMGIYVSEYITLIAENILLRKEAASDGLTKLYVYRYFEVFLKKNFRKALDAHRRLALTIYDIDHFKEINDNHGHVFGNTVLETIAKILKDNSRMNDLVARYGGEEFCVLAKDMKDHDVLRYAERIRDKVKRYKFKTPNGKIITVTISGGIATIGRCKLKNFTDLIKAADIALYKSKTSGRDKISCYR